MIGVVIMSPRGERLQALEIELTQDPSLAVVGRGSTFPLVRSILEQAAADVVLIDLPSGAEAQTTRDWLIDLGNSLPLVILIPAPDIWLFHQAVRRGAGALLHHDARS